MIHFTLKNKFLRSRERAFAWLSHFRAWAQAQARINFSFMMFIFFLISPFLIQADPLLLKRNLEKGQAGDYVVMAQGQTYTLFHILENQKGNMTVEEITIPSTLADPSQSWREWVANKAPGNTSWIQYKINLHRNEIGNFYSFTKGGAFTIPDAENFLATLLKLELKPIPDAMRRKIGHVTRENTRLWQPKMVVDGQPQEGVLFDAYSTVWPKDGGPLSGRMIEIYLPKDSDQYPAYFPYWLQAKGMAGQANMRVVDSGKGLFSSRQSPL